MQNNKAVHDYIFSSEGREAHQPQPEYYDID